MLTKYAEIITRSPERALFVVKTLAPATGVPTSTNDAAPTGQIIARRHAFWLDDYDHYVGTVAQATAVDIDKAAQAFATLAADPALRQTMGAAGRARALAIYDWRHVIAAYRGLLDQLAEIRGRAPARAAQSVRAVAQPTRMDPFRMFAHYPTRLLSGSTRLIAGSMRRIADIPGGIERAAIIAYGLPPVATLDAMVDRAAQPIELADLVGAFPEQDRRLITAAAAFLLKMGLLARA